MAKNNLIDIELIKQYVDITEEELMMRLVKDAVGLQKEAERNKRRKEMEDRLAGTSIYTGIGSSIQYMLKVLITIIFFN